MTEYFTNTFKCTFSGLNYISKNIHLISDEDKKDIEPELLGYIKMINKKYVNTMYYLSAVCIVLIDLNKYFDYKNYTLGAIKSIEYYKSYAWKIYRTDYTKVNAEQKFINNLAVRLNNITNNEPQPQPQPQQSIMYRFYNIVLSTIKRLFYIFNKKQKVEKSDNKKSSDEMVLKNIKNIINMQYQTLYSIYKEYKVSEEYKNGVYSVSVCSDNITQTFT